MKSVICLNLIGLYLVIVFFKTDAVRIDPITQNELNRRLRVRGAMGGNITLMSNSSIGTGGFSFVLSGKTNDGVPVAIKATAEKYLQFYTQEYQCYEKMNATTDKLCEKYGIPFIYHSGNYLNFKIMAMTRLDLTLQALQRKIGLFSKESILIIFRDMIKTLKFVHSKGIIHLDIKSNNIMTKGANVFLCDFNSGVNRKLVKHLGNGKPSAVWDQDSGEYYDMVRLFDIMCSLTYTPASCNAEKILDSEKEMSEMKGQIKEELLLEMRHIELVESYVEFLFEVIDAMQTKRLPKYDYLYNMFDDLLYTGRNRSERIVFDWLSPAKKVAAMAEHVTPIESIVFLKKLIE